MSANCEKEIEFLSDYLPLIKAGQYNIEVIQNATIDGKNPCEGKEPYFKMIRTFSVGEPQFSLSPSDIHSVFPPANHRGNFNNCLPHIVLTRATLPWEREMDSQDNKIPWMALLLFDENDNIECKNLKVFELLTKKEENENLKGLDLYKEYIKQISENETCTVIDIPLELFSALVATKKELGFLAHARKVDTNNKDESSPDKDKNLTDKERWFSVVVGNRLPASGDNETKNTVHLVSLEGFCNLLPDGKEYKTNPNVVRLISLASWSFLSTKEKRNFGDLAEKLDFGTFGDIKKDGKLTHNNSGYARLKHITRLGKCINSWYRGPFIPYKRSADLDSLHSCADAALRYDKNTNEFDVSYAAAWQLGRLLALQNRSFAAAIFNWRRKKLQLKRIGLNKGIIERKLSMLTFSGSSGTGINNSVIAKLVNYIKQNYERET